MFALFLSIVVLTAGIAGSILFYVLPQYSNSFVKGANISIAKTTPEVTVISKAPTDTPPPTSTPENTVAPTLKKYNLVNTVQPTSITTVPSNQTPTEILSPVLTITPNATISPILTSSPTPIDLSIPIAATSSSDTSTITDVTKTQQSGLNSDTIFNLVNYHRKSLGLPLFQIDTDTCTVAKKRAPAVYNEIFGSNSLDSGLASLHLPYWITETIIYEDTEQNAVNWWLNDNNHKQIIEGNYKFSCAACSGNACAEVYTNYISK